MQLTEASTESEMTQEDCEERGGTWSEAPDREGEYYCDTPQDDSLNQSDEETTSDDSQREEE